MPKKLHLSTSAQCVQHEKQNHHNYYLENKEKIKQMMSQKVHCPYCDQQITKCKLERHYRSNRHQMKVIEFDELH